MTEEKIIHDLGTVLMTITEAAKILASGHGLPEDGRKKLDVILHSAEFGASLLQRLRQESPIIDFRRIELGSLIRRVAQAVTTTAGSVEIRCDLQCEVRTVADENLVERVLLNLANNAVQAMPDGGTLTFGLYSDDGGGAKITVTDTGIGMDEKTLRRIFDPRFTTKKGGMGLGLSIVAETLETLGWDIEVESAPGKGTTFTVLVPEASAFRFVGGYSPALRILLVDDDPDLVSLIQETLEEEGHEVSAYTSPFRAIRQIERGWRPDVLVTDSSMPEMSGPALIRKVREILPGIPAMILTGIEPENVPDETTVLLKPVSTAEILRWIRRIADENRNGNGCRELVSIRSGFVSANRGEEGQTCCLTP